MIVGTLGWDNSSIHSALCSWIERGDAFMLNAVPAGDLRTLYRNAAATVCPSLGEGFDFSGVEAMRSGGLTIASDIPVHREVYGDAAVYFDPYSTMSLVSALEQTLYDEGASRRAEQMKRRGDEVSSRYLPEVILPQWAAFIAKLTGNPAAAAIQAHEAVAEATAATPVSLLDLAA